MNSILSIHNKVLSYFIERRKRDPQFYFAVRIKNNKNRKDSGYWFLGNDDYIHLSFWEGQDWREKVYNIGFVIHSDLTSKIELSAQDSIEKAAILRTLIREIPGFVQIGNKNKWWKPYNDNQYMTHLQEFLSTYKPVIDELLIHKEPNGIGFLSESYYQKHVVPIINTYQKLNGNNYENKITRITWNKYNWQRPSGPEGKSKNKEAAFEATSGYGHEEWLLDKMRILPDGYHYGFIRGLDLKTEKHVGNIYNISLYAKHSSGTNHYVATLYNAECISPRKSAEVYRYYKTNGWLNGMLRDLTAVNVDLHYFNNMEPGKFFNIRFKFENSTIEEEPVLISPDDVNINTDHFKLLPFKGKLLFADTISAQSASGSSRTGSRNQKNTDKRRKSYKVECEYDPYHDMMQNELFELLNQNFEGYKNIEMERNWVDISAITSNGEYHFFEIKTDGPITCIRKAIGQILEYAYYPEYRHAEKLFVIGDSYPNAETQKYLRYLRGEFKLPVFYRAFDMRTRSLSTIF